MSFGLPGQEINERADDQAAERRRDQATPRWEVGSEREGIFVTEQQLPCEQAVPKRRTSKKAFLKDLNQKAEQHRPDRAREATANCDQDREEVLGDRGAPPLGMRHGGNLAGFSLSAVRVASLSRWQAGRAAPRCAPAWPSVISLSRI